MIKILFFIRNYFNGGAEKALFEIAKNLDKSKYDVTILVSDDSGGNREKFNENLKCINAYNVFKPGKNIFTKCYNYIYLKLLHKNYFKGKHNLFYNKCVRGDYDIEVAFMHNEVTPIIACGKSKAKKVTWVHTDIRIHNGWTQYFKNIEERTAIYKKFDRIICVSEEVRQSVADVMGITEKTEVHYNPVDDKKIIAMSEEKLNFEVSHDVPIICAVGRLSFEKGFDRLIKIHKKLISENIRHKLWIVGEGNERKKLEALIEELGVGDTVTLVGYTQNPYKYLKNCDFSVCSSLYEGLSIASMESILLSKPVVSCCAVVGEILGENKCGIICENNDNALYESIKNVLTDKELLSDMVCECEKRRGFFKLKDTITKIEKMFDDLVKENKNA